MATTPDPVGALLELAESSGQTPEQLVEAIRQRKREQVIAAARQTIPVQTLPDGEFAALITGMLDGEDVGDTQTAYLTLIAAMQSGDQTGTWAALLVFLKAFRREHVHWEAVAATSPAPPAPVETVSAQ